MSVVLVVFSGAPKVSPEAQQKDLQLNVILEKKVKGMLLRFRVLISNVDVLFQKF